MRRATDATPARRACGRHGAGAAKHVLLRVAKGVLEHAWFAVPVVEWSLERGDAEAMREKQEAERLGHHGVPV